MRLYDIVALVTPDLNDEDAQKVASEYRKILSDGGAEIVKDETWGRRRLNLIEPLLPFATSVDIYLKGRGLPSFYAVKLPDMTFVLGLSVIAVCLSWRDGCSHGREFPRTGSRRSNLSCRV